MSSTAFDGNWLNEYQLRRKLTITEVAEHVGEPVHLVEAALRARRAPAEWQRRLSDKRALKSRIHNIRKSWAKRVAE